MNTVLNAVLNALNWSDIQVSAEIPTQDDERYGRIHVCELTLGEEMTPGEILQKLGKIECKFAPPIAALMYAAITYSKSQFPHPMVALFENPNGFGVMQFWNIGLCDQHLHVYDGDEVSTTKFPQFMRVLVVGKDRWAKNPARKIELLSSV